MASMVARAAPVDRAGADGRSVLQAIWADAGQPTGEVTTEEVRQILADGSAIVVDTRSTAEFAAGHLPGVRNIPTRADGPAADYAKIIKEANITTR